MRGQPRNEAVYHPAAEGHLYPAARLQIIVAGIFEYSVHLGVGDVYYYLCIHKFISNAPRKAAHMNRIALFLKVVTGSRFRRFIALPALPRQAPADRIRNTSATL